MVKSVRVGVSGRKCHVKTSRGNPYGEVLGCFWKDMTFYFIIQTGAREGTTERDSICEEYGVKWVCCILSMTSTLGEKVERVTIRNSKKSDQKAIGRCGLQRSGDITEETRDPCKGR